MKINKFYFINLDKRPNRRDHFLEQCERENVPNNLIERFPALDGETYNFTSKELELFKKSDFIHRWFAKRIIGNQLSHYYIMQDAIKNKYEYIVVFQDDSILRKDFMKHIENVLENLPENAEMVNLGLHKHCFFSQFVRWDLSSNDDEEKISKERVNEYICKLKHGMNPCSLSYILTLKGAENMVNYFETNGFLRATDGNFNDYLESKDIFYSSLPILVTGNSDLPSDIFIQ